LLLPLFERDVLPDDAFPRFATGACADVPLSARLTAVFFDAPAAVFAAAPAPFDDAAFTALLAVRADVRVDFGAAAAFV
jgi:hypothetical protein